jgi:transposase InsO family protein
MMTFTDDATRASFIMPLEKYLKQKGIKHETTAPNSPDQNGVAERLNRTIMERSKAILADTGLPKTLDMDGSRKHGNVPKKLLSNESIIEHNTLRTMARRKT